MSKFASLLCGATVAAGVLAASAASATVPTYIYEVTVRTSFGTKFMDCWTFHGGTLVISDLGYLTYAAAPSDPKHFYTAVATLSTAESIGFTIAFAGFKVGGTVDGKFAAVGADEFRDSYEIRGKTVAACTTSASGTNPYKAQ